MITMPESTKSPAITGSNERYCSHEYRKNGDVIAFFSDETGKFVLSSNAHLPLSDCR